MTRRSRLAAAAVLSLAATVVPGVARGADALIEMFRRSFLPESVTIEVGDTVRWQWVRGDHTVTSGRPDGAPGTPDEPGALFDTVLDEANPVFEYTFDEFREGGYFFFDRRNPDQLGFVSLDTGEVVFRVAVVDNVFNPEEAYIFAGDSIKWEHEPMEDLHTVTSGTGSDDPESGRLFDEESSDAKPIFVYQFLDAGEYPYYCIPHERMGMKGVIFVQRNFLRGDAAGDGNLDITDAINILGVLFLGDSPPSCEDAFDANDDGDINISDASFLLNFLFSGGQPIPKPFPRAGADRTEDMLFCF